MAFAARIPCTALSRLQGCNCIERQAATISPLTHPRCRAGMFCAVQRLPVCATYGTSGREQRNPGLSRLS